MPKWMASIDSLAPAKALGLGVLLAGANPKNLLLAIAAGAGLAQLGLSTTDAVVALIVFVVIGSLTIAGPVVYYLVGGDDGEGAARLDEAMARRAQRRRDDGAVPRLRRRPDRKGPWAADGLTPAASVNRRLSVG